MTVIFGEDGKELTWTLAISVYTGFSILYLLLTVARGMFSLLTSEDATN